MLYSVPVYRYVCCFCRKRVIVVSFSAQPSKKMGVINFDQITRMNGLLIFVVTYYMPMVGRKCGANYLSSIFEQICASIPFLLIIYEALHFTTSFE